MSSSTVTDAGRSLPTGAAAGKRRIVVALVISNLEFGGAERQVVELANHLDPADFEVHLVSLSSYVPLASRLRPERAKLHVVEKRGKYDAGVVLRLAALFRALQVDVAHAFLFDAEIAGRLAARLAGAAAVIGSERNSNYEQSRMKRLLYRATAPLMDLCIANSRAGAEYNRQRMKQSATKYRVVYNGVDTDRFRPRSREAARERLGVPAGGFCAGIFGSFKPQKNHLMFFAAAAELLRARPDATFLVVGDSLEEGRRGSYEYKQRVQDLVSELRLEARCLFLGNRDDVEELYPACDVTVLPSLHEGTPNVALESMACGVPVVVTDVADNSIVVPHGEVGFVVPLGDVAALAARLAALAADPALCRRLGERGRAWVDERFTNAQLAANTGRVYREAARGRSGAAARRAPA